MVAGLRPPHRSVRGGAGTRAAGCGSPGVSDRGVLAAQARPLWYHMPAFHRPGSGPLSGPQPATRRSVQSAGRASSRRRVRLERTGSHFLAPPPECGVLEGPSRRAPAPDAVGCVTARGSSRAAAEHWPIPAPSGAARRPRRPRTRAPRLGVALAPEKKAVNGRAPKAWTPPPLLAAKFVSLSCDDQRCGADASEVGHPYPPPLPRPRARVAGQACAVLY